MSTRYHVGAKSLSGNLESYAKRFDLLEVRLDARVNESTLRRYRRTVAPHFEFAVVAPPALAALKSSPELDAEIERTTAAIAALQARVLVLSTPTDVTPAAVWRERMNKVLERLPRDATQVVWEPHGVWEIEEATRAAKRFGVVLCVDAAREKVPAGAIAYVRLPALGAARSYGEAALDRVVQAVGERREAYVVIETTTALKECKTLRRLSQGPGKRTGGGGLLLRPKAPVFRVRDDEQE